ncbi:hypothetical protein HYH03_002421 [Edaphochlamys debaryana]|uniref:Vacuolar cation/proton exchanger n=1 Tax=Edaphochlamys debaryana TaxID=47281 RepID=A0A835YKP9_9CHLO|nr:hypothetical protein HYH03_002421 [Edaphochlamys debaryana]|eukprot:KAG2499474.1 hypothetical protein HYH03_002421 [Edaphochlamys debaryana]
MLDRTKAFTVVRAASRLQVLAARRRAQREAEEAADGETQPLVEEAENGVVDPQRAAAIAEAESRRAAFGQCRSMTMRRPPVPPAWWKSDLQALKEILSNWMNVLLVAVPLGLAAGYLKWDAAWVFSLNFLALIPLALVLGDVTEDLALRYGSVIGGLINATFGNIVEIILSVAALLNGLYGVVAASLLGSILSNLLLVLGCSFFFGGLYNKTQRFNATGNQASGSLLFLAALGFLIPTGAGLLFGGGADHNPQEVVLGISRGTAVILLICYACYLGFQLYTHTDLFEDEPNEEGEAQEPMMTLFTSVAMLTAITVVVAMASEFLTSSLEEFSKSSGLGEAFLGTIILPIAGNACEHMTAVIVATKNKMDLSMGVAIGSSIQVALFAVPFAVVVGWATGHPFTLSFDPFSAMALMLSVAQTNFVTAGATSHWLLGVQLIALYVLISLAYFFK